MARKGLLRASRVYLGRDPQAGTRKYHNAVVRSAFARQSGGENPAPCSSLMRLHIPSHYYR
jgi:hypothetical protein